MATPSTGYVESVFSAPTGDVSDDVALVLDMSQISSNDFWTACDSSDGTKLRFYDSSDTEKAFDPIEFDNSAETGIIRIGWTGGVLAASADSARTVKVYPSDSGNTSYSASDTYGSDNAYDSNWEGYWPLTSDFNDRTSNGNNLTTEGSISAGGVTGLLGDATDFDGVDDRTYAQNVVSMSSSTEYTVISSWYTDAFDKNSSFKHFIWELSDDYTNTTDSFRLTCGKVDFVNIVTVSTDGGNTGTTSADTHGVSWSTGTWYQSAVVWDQPNTHLQWYNDGASIYNNTSYSDTSSASDIILGSDDATADWFDGRQQHFQTHSTARSADWIALEYDQTNDNATFWGTWTWNSGVSAPVADFSASPTSGEAPLSVTFTDASTNTPTSWSWDVDGDASEDYTSQNPSHTYNAAGTYTVTLTATNAGGSDDETKTDYITVTAASPVSSSNRSRFLSRVALH